MEDILRMEPSLRLGFQAKDGGVRRVTLPLSTACKAGASLFSHGPVLNEKCTVQSAEWPHFVFCILHFALRTRRPGAAPGALSFGDSAARAGARRI